MLPIIIGSVLCILAGVGVGTFLLPLKFSKSWQWENSWFVGSVFMYVLFPAIGLWLLIPEFSQIYADTPSKDIVSIYILGLIQGTGAYIFTYGTTIMGLALGYALMISCIALFSLLVTLFGAHMDRVFQLDGITLLIGAVLLVAGFVVAGRAGMIRERETASSKNQDQPKKKINLLLIVVIVLWTGIANSMYYFTFEFQQSMKTIAIEQYQVPDYAWGFLNVLPFFLGIFTFNSILTIGKIIKDRAMKNFWSAKGLAREYMLAIVIGVLWYLGQGVAYPAGQAILGPLGVAVGAALFMGMIIVASNVAGIRTGEWKGLSKATMWKLYLSIIILVLAMTVIAVGNYLQQVVFKV